MDVDIPILTEPTVATPFQLLSLAEKLFDDATPITTTNCVQNLFTACPSDDIGIMQSIVVTELIRMDAPQRNVELNTVDDMPPAPAQLSPGTEEAAGRAAAIDPSFNQDSAMLSDPCNNRAEPTSLNIPPTEFSDYSSRTTETPSTALPSLSTYFAYGTSAGNTTPGLCLPAWPAPLDIERPSVLQRSISSPLSTPNPVFSNIDIPTVSTSVSECVRVALTERKEENARKRKKLVLGTNVKFPEAVPPAIRPRFQWYQAKGIIRVHLLIRNVLPTNFRFTCNGRDMEFRAKADNCPYPPTLPENPTRPLIDYHLPFRLTHRVYTEPEFSRISPSRIEIHFKKVKPFVEWAALWKIPSGIALKNDRDPMAESSEDDESEEQSEEEENSPIRPSKRSVNVIGSSEPSKPSGEPTLPKVCEPNGEPSSQQCGEPSGDSGETVMSNDGMPTRELNLPEVESNGTKDIEKSSSPSSVSSDQEMTSVSESSPVKEPIAAENEALNEKPVENVVLEAMDQGAENNEGLNIHEQEQMSSIKVETDPYDVSNL